MGRVGLNHCIDQLWNEVIGSSRAVCLLQRILLSIQVTLLHMLFVTALSVGVDHLVKVRTYDDPTTVKYAH